MIHGLGSLRARYHVDQRFSLGFLGLFETKRMNDILTAFKIGIIIVLAQRRVLAAS